MQSGRLLQYSPIRRLNRALDHHPCSQVTTYQTQKQFISYFPGNAAI